MTQDWVYRDSPDSRSWPPQAAPQQQPTYDQQARLEQIRRRTEAYGRQSAASAPAFTPRAPQPPKNRAPRGGKHAGRKILAGAGGLIAAIIVISVAAGSGHGTTSNLSAGTGTQTQTAAPAAKGAAQTPVIAPANTAPAGTTSQMQALSAAEQYLGDGQGFSRQGLIDQLDSSFGDSFSVADATWGVDHSDADWDDQAVDCAKGYLSDGEGFSRESLIQQMTSTYGDRFTEAQAEYAARAVGL